jgi:hypothetical protein
MQRRSDGAGWTRSIEFLAVFTGYWLDVDRLMDWLNDWHWGGIATVARMLDARAQVGQCEDCQNGSAF